MIPLRAMVVVALVFGLVLVRRLYLRWRANLHRPPSGHPRVPRHLLEGAARTWVVFTSPYCASCAPVEQRLRTSDPSARVVKVDATRQRELASAFSVRSAPTVLLADRSGAVQARLVGAGAVESYLGEAG